VADTKVRIEQMVDDLVTIDPRCDEFLAARNILAVQQTDVIYELAAAALVDAARRRRRSGALAVERSSEVPEVVTERPRGASGHPVKRGTARYWKWVETTDEGREYEASMSEVDAQFGQRLTERLTTVVEDFKSSLRIEWTNELLSTEIAMPDGTRTTWGAATIDQHAERAEMFEQMAQGNIEGAVRHRKAIDELRASGVDSLAQMVMASA